MVVSYAGVQPGLPFSHACANFTMNKSLQTAGSLLRSVTSGDIAATMSMNLIDRSIVVTILAALSLLGLYLLWQRFTNR